MSSHFINIPSTCVQNQEGFQIPFYASFPGRIDFDNIPYISSGLPAQDLSENQCPVKKTNANKNVPKERKRERRVIPATVKRNRQLRRNARERERQSRLNNAFDVLRGVIPDYLTGKGPERKLTQIETLRLAQHYIMALSELLQDSRHDSSCNRQCYGMMDI
jgi:hypothetical protein